MAQRWQRKRHPDEVPTPLAVALSDFCRRAKAAAGPAEVREALAILSPDDEFRVRQLTDREPEASPLGPFAAVDVLLGTAPALAAERQRTGYYELARALASERAQPKPQPEPEAPLREFLAPAESERRAAKKKGEAPRPSIAERIAPKKRTAERAPEPAAGAEEVPQEADRERPQPRGRFTRVAAPKQPFEALLSPEASESVGALVQQHPHRYAVWKALSHQYSGHHGPMTLEELDEALSRHGLSPLLAEKERQSILAAYTEHRGAGGRAAWGLGLSPGELKAVVSALGIEPDVEAIREHFRREALAPSNVGHRLDLVARTKYLDDLCVRREFRDHLSRDLLALLRQSARGTSGVDAVVEEVSKKHGLSATQLRRALDRLGLTDDLERRVADSAPALR